MDDAEKSNAELLREISQLRQRLTEAETLNQALQESLSLDEAERSDLRFRLFYEQAPLPYQSLDEAGNLLDVNPAWLALFGYQREEIIGRWFGDLLTAASRAHFGDCFPRFKAAGVAHEIEFDIVRKDGAVRAVSFEGRIGYDEQGRFRQTHCICVDVTARKEMEQALRASKSEKELILDSLNEMVAYQDLDHHIIWANKASADSVGLAPEALRGRFCYELWQQRADTCPFCPADRTVAAGQPAEAETITPDGRRFLIRTSPVFGEDGAVLGIVEIGQNITQQRQAEERVQRLLEQQIIINTLAMALGNATELDAIYHTIHQHVSSLMDADTFIVASYNAEQEQFRAGYVANGGERLDASRFPPVPLEPPGKGTQSQVIHTGEPVYLPDLHTVLRETCSQHTIMEDGSVVKGPPPEETESSCSALLVPMKIHGDTVGVIQVQSTRRDAYSQDDIALLSGLANVAAVAIQNATLHTQTVRRAERLAMVTRIARAVGSILQVDDLLETVYREITAIFQTDAFLIALYDEQAGELDYRIQVDGETRLPPERQPLGKGLMSHIIANGQPLLIRDASETYPEPILWGEGPDTVSWLGVPMRISNHVIGAISVQSYKAYAYDQDDQTILGIIADQVAIAIENARLYENLQNELRERRRLEEQLLQSQKMEAIGRLAGGVAHDFNNLLTVINGYSQLIMSSLEPDAPLRQDIKEIAEAGGRAAALTRQLLAFSRRQMMEMRVLDLNQILEGMSRMLQRIIGEDMHLDMNLAHSLYPIKADPGQIEQVVVNLAANARDAMPAGGSLVIETSTVSLDSEYVANHLDVQPGDYTLLTISDTGHGMSAEVRAHLFEPFFTTKEIGQGTGLGLATVYGIIKQLGGNIQVYSEVGLGTSFKIYLPRCDETPLVLAESAAPLPHGDETILVIEDEDDVRRLAERLLGQLGYSVIGVNNLDAAIQALAQDSGAVSLALVDVVMPKISGPQVVAQLHRIRPDLRALYMSGYTDRAIAHHGLLEPNARLLQKPFTVEQIATQVRRALDDPA